MGSVAPLLAHPQTCCLKDALHELQLQLQLRQPCRHAFTRIRSSAQHRRWQVETAANGTRIR